MLINTTGENSKYYFTDDCLLVKCVSGFVARVVEAEHYL